VTGRIVDTTEQAVSALPQVLVLDRRAVRRRFEERFSATRMAKYYVNVYRKLLQRAPALEERTETPNVETIESTNNPTNGHS
jgi:2-phosphoglycerate kinase